MSRESRSGVHFQNRTCPDANHRLEPLSRGRAIDMSADIRQNVRLTITLAEQRIGFVAIDKAFRGGIEVESAAGTKGDLGEMNRSAASMSNIGRGLCRCAMSYGVERNSAMCSA